MHITLTTRSKPVKSLDDIFTYIGKINAYQIFLIFIVLYTGALHAFAITLTIFTQATPDFVCLDTVPTSTEKANSELAESPHLQKTPWINQCHYQNENNQTQTCQNFIFDNSTFYSTVTEDFNLICSQKSHVYSVLINSIFYIGYTIGSVLGGYFSDNYGRKKPLIIFNVIFIMTVFFQGFIPSSNFTKSDWMIFPTQYFPLMGIWLYILNRLVQGISAMASWILAFIYIIDLVPSSSRTFYGTLMGVFYAGFGIIVAILAFYFRYWREMSVMATWLFLPIFYYLYIPESLVYLYSRGDLQAVADIFYQYRDKKSPTYISKKEIYSMLQELQKYEAIENSMQTKSEEDDIRLLSETDSDTDLKRKTPPKSVLDLFKHGANMTKVTIIFMIIGFNITAIFHGLSLNSAVIPVNPYLAVIIYAISDVTARFISIPFLNSPTFGRKYTLALCLLITGICCFVTTILHGYTASSTSDTSDASTSDNNNTNTILKITHLMFSFLGRGAIGATYSNLFIYAGELYPTPIKSIGVSLQAIFGGLGAVFMPIILKLSLVHVNLPGFTFAVCSWMSSYLIMLLPETVGLPNINTFEDIELVYENKFYSQKV